EHRDRGERRYGESDRVLVPHGKRQPRAPRAAQLVRALRGRAREGRRRMAVQQAEDLQRAGRRVDCGTAESRRAARARPEIASAVRQLTDANAMRSRLETGSSWSRAKPP